MTGSFTKRIRCPDLTGRNSDKRFLELVRAAWAARIPDAHALESAVAGQLGLCAQPRIDVMFRLRIQFPGDNPMPHALALSFLLTRRPQPNADWKVRRLQPGLSMT